MRGRGWVRGRVGKSERRAREEEDEGGEEEGNGKRNDDGLGPYIGIVNVLRVYFSNNMN